MFGCHQNSKNITSESAVINGDVTLLWNDIPSANSYNVYVSDSPGVTKLSGYKISNITNPFRIKQLEPGKTYYFVITVVNQSGESKESKELSYFPVTNKIGLVYWKNLFDESIQDPNSKNAEKGQEIKATPEGVSLKNEALSDSTTENKLSSINLAKKNLRPSRERVDETVDSQEDVSENSKLTTAPVETSTDHNLLELETMRLKTAQVLTDSHFYIFFAQNSNELSTKAIEKLDQIYKILTNNADAKLTLNGYSDSSGDPSINRMVSEVRAYSVKSYLSGKGINPSRMMAFGHGAQNFLVSNNSAEGRRLNRRVEIELIVP